MTEVEWLTESDLFVLFGHEMPSERKLRLFAAACGRAVWRHIQKVACCREFCGQFDGDCMASIEVAERFADGLATERERSAAQNVLYRPVLNAANSAAINAVQQNATWAAVFAAFYTANISDIFDSKKEVWARQTSLFRQTVGDFKDFEMIIPDRDTLRLAEAVYRQNPFDPVTIKVLADSLEDQGYYFPELRDNVREYKGYWLVDRILGKK